VTTRLAYGRREAADRCGVGVDTIDRAIATGALKARKTSQDKDGNPTGKILILEADIRAWLEGLPAA
jgi:hypothetical protein